MAKEYCRTQRVAQQMQKEIAIILQCKIRDPRIGMVTLSGVELSRDLSYAKVIVSILSEDAPDRIKNSIHALQSAAGFIRNLLGKAMYLRIVPELIFTYDNSLAAGIRISNLINQAVKNDHLRRSKYKSKCNG